MKDIIKTIKEIHKETICLFRVGTFYHCYNRDAYILSYFFHYKIKRLELNEVECGFPVASIGKITAKLENHKINYTIIDRRNNYDEEQFQNYKNLNEYIKWYEKAKKYVNNKERIEKIYEILMQNVEEEKLRKVLGRIENIIYERG